MYLLDTNILIYLLGNNPKIKNHLAELNQERFSISIISRLELLIGAAKQGLSEKLVESYLDHFENIVLDKNIVGQAVKFNQENNKKLKFKDLVIAATAKVNKKRIITSDQDFKNLTGIDVLCLKL